MYDFVVKEQVVSLRCLVVITQKFPLLKAVRECSIVLLFLFYNREKSENNLFYEINFLWDFNLGICIEDVCVIVIIRNILSEELPKIRFASANDSEPSHIFYFLTL